MIRTDIAPIRGTVSLYMHMDNSIVLLMKDNYKYFATRLEAFNDLYFELDETRAALKEDCIRYVIYTQHKYLCEYPDWFINAYDNGYIYNEDGYNDYIMYNEHGDIVLSPGGIVLCNYNGQVTYMERDHFERYYEIIGG